MRTLDTTCLSGIRHVQKNPVITHLAQGRDPLSSKHAHASLQRPISGLRLPACLADALPYLSFMGWSSGETDLGASHCNFRNDPHCHGSGHTQSIMRFPSLPSGPQTWRLSQAFLTHLLQYPMYLELTPGLSSLLTKRANNTTTKGELFFPGLKTKALLSKACSVCQPCNSPSPNDSPLRHFPIVSFFLYHSSLNASQMAATISCLELQKSP